MQKKILSALASVIITILLFAMPIIAVGAIVAVPVQAVSEFFDGISDFLFGDGTTSADELIALIQMSMANSENQTKIQKTYAGKLSKHDIDVPEHWLVVVQLLSGIEFEDMSDAYINALVDFAIKESYDQETDETTYKLSTVEVYSDSLMKIAPFNTKLSKVPSSTLTEIINRVGSINSWSGLSPELIEKYKDRLMYPFSSIYPVGDSIGLYYPNGKAEEHNGLDLRAPCGTPTYAMDDGVVTMVESFNYWRGNYVVWGNGSAEYRYLHFRDPLTLRVGDKVTKGQYVGTVGNTGYSFGCHLHLEIHIDGEIVDPLALLEVDSLR